MMRTGIVGIGLIGGSLCKALRDRTDMEIFGYDTNESTVLAAELTGDIDGVLNSDTIPGCDMLLLCVYPRACVEFVRDNLGLIKPGAVVVDTCGTKRYVCGELFALARKHGFTFVGGHPMAGTQYSGYTHSKSTLFNNATMLLCPDSDADFAKTEEVKRFFLSVGFGAVGFTTPEHHDSQIAFTSQLAHVVSNAYVKSPAALEHRGFSAGSYRDLTRVARLNPQMWSELFTENRDNLSRELDILIQNLCLYRDAVKDGDEEALFALLADGVSKKNKADGRGG